MEPRSMQQLWHDLPPDAKALVIRNLADNVQDLGNCALASQELKQLAQPWIWRGYACNACGTPAFHARHMVQQPADIELKMDGHPALRFSAALAAVGLESQVTTAFRASGCYVDLDTPFTIHDNILVADQPAAWQFAHCGGCSRTLGVRFCAMPDIDETSSVFQTAYSALSNHFVVSSHYVHLVGPGVTEQGAYRNMDPTPQQVHCCSGVRSRVAAATSAAQTAAAAGAAAAAAAGAGSAEAGAGTQAVIAQPGPAAGAAPAALTEMQPHTSAAGALAAGNASTAHKAAHSKPPICGNELFPVCAVLNVDHRWDVGGGVLERAAFVNHLLPGSFVEEAPEEQELMQGRMEIAHVACSRCGGRIGWKFVKDLSEESENGHQVGRFGIVKSSVLVEQGAKCLFSGR